MNKNHQTEYMGFFCTPDFKKKVRLAFKTNNLNFSGYVRELILKAIDGFEFDGNKKPCIKQGKR